MVSVGRLRRITPREIASRLAEQTRFVRERAEAARGRRPRLSPIGPGETGVPVISFGALVDRDEARRLWMKLFPQSASEAVSRADGICENKIPLFSETVDFGKEIDWHLEYRTGERAPLEFYRDLHGIDRRTVGDRKNTWELNRHNFLLDCAKAYLATGERRYYEKWKQIVLSWIEDNPYNMGINWESSIELAIRAINWIWSSHFFADALAEDRALAGRIREALLLHAHHIERHLSYYFSPNTHLTAEALGLVSIGRSFPGTAPAPRWVSRGFEILEAELDRQVLEDGGYFEMATYYQKYTIDIYLLYLLLKGESARWSPKAASRIARLVKHLVLISEPDGTIPLIGDSDGGELLHLGTDKRNLAGACCAAAILLGDPELAALGGGVFREEALWLLGARGFEAFEKMERRSAPSECHSINTDTGLFCFRTGMTADDSYVTIDCGPHGWGACGHAHADLLSFEWFCCGVTAIVDPGTYTYGGSKKVRDEVRSSQRHNTITIDGVSQSVPGDTFGWKRIAHPKQVRVTTLGKPAFFEGGHDAYDSIGCGHRRAILFFGGDLTVVADFITITRPRRSLLYALQFNEGTLEQVGARVYRYSHPRAARSCFARFIGTREFTVSIRESEIYPDYNRAVSAPRLELVEEDLSSDHVIVALLGDDRSVTDGFVLGTDGRLTGRCASGELTVLFAGNGVDRVLVNRLAVPL